MCICRTHRGFNKEHTESSTAKFKKVRSTELCNKKKKTLLKEKKISPTTVIYSN